MKRMLFLLTMMAALVVSADTYVRDGDRIAFLGDSITQFGNDPGGYIRLVMQGFEYLGVKPEKIAAGVSGHKSNDMLKRLKSSVLRHNPKYMTLSCGVNDVWHGAKGVKLEDYKQNVTEILNQCAASNVTVLVLTPTMIFESPEGGLNKKLEPYNEFLRETAKARGLQLVDLNADMRALLKTYPATKGTKLTRDGVHMNWDGNRMMARGVLKGFGVTEAQLAEIEKVWYDMPETNHTSCDVSRRVYEKLHKLARERGVKVKVIVSEILTKSQAD